MSFVQNLGLYLNPLQSLFVLQYVQVCPAVFLIYFTPAAVILLAPLALTLRLLMSYVYGAPSKARNANVVYTECPRRNVKYFGRVFLMLNYTDITQNTYVPS